MPDPSVTDDPGPRLLALALAAIERYLEDGSTLAFPDDPLFAQRGACFVTLQLDGALRGCIGSLRPQRRLGEDIVRNAIAAASADPRFPPLSRAEFDRVALEVSWLSPPEFLDFTDEADLLRQLRPGLDGLIFFSGCRSATFLPQVWTQLPEPARFLAALKHKAGLDPDRPAPSPMAARYTVRHWHRPATAARSDPS